MKIKLLFVSMILFGCVERKESTLIVTKYKVGDVVYLKPDSTTAVIEVASSTGEWYNVLYKTELGKIEYLIMVKPTSIY
jgi:hypothetical protein